MGRLYLAVFWVLPWLNATFRAEAFADFRDFRFAPLERLLARVNGVHAARELVRVLDRRSQDEARVLARLEVERAVRFLEYREFPCLHDLRRGELALVHGDPGDCVLFRRFVAPFLALLQRDIQIVHRRRRGHLARGFTEATKDDSRRTLRLEMLAPEIACFGCDVLHLRRQSDPELIALDARGPHRASGVPYAAPCTHPFDASRLDDAFRSGGVLVGDLPFENERKRCDAGMRMPTDGRHALRVDLEIIQEHERLDRLAHVGRTDEPRDGAVRTATRAVDDAAGARFRSLFDGSRCVHIHVASFERIRNTISPCCPSW